MSASRLGLRYERLLFFAGPLSIAALLVLFIAVATDSQQEKLQTRCYAEGVKALEAKKAELDGDWALQLNRKSARLSPDYRYELALRFVWIPALLGNGNCYALFEHMKSDELNLPPEALIKKFKQLADVPIIPPGRFYGVQIPEVATIGVFGTEIKIELVVFTQALQIALAPLLILWLGSLYSTRFRETMLTGKASQITEIFPHLLNAYAIGQVKALRKKSWIRYFAPRLLAYWYAFTRGILVLVFTGPPVVFYLASLYFLHESQNLVLIGVLGFLVMVFCLANVMAEFFPWHVQKIFPGPFKIG